MLLAHKKPGSASSANGDDVSLNRNNIFSNRYQLTISIPDPKGQKSPFYQYNEFNQPTRYNAGKKGGAPDWLLVPQAPRPTT